MRSILAGIHSLPLFLGLLLSIWLWKFNFLLLVIYIVIVTLVITTGRDRKLEWRIFGYGVVASFIVENVGASFAGYQQWVNPDFGNIPLWLLVAWGYGFVLMKRIGFILAHASPWAKHE